MGGAMARKVQPKSTPRRKPRNSGGSPSGVSEPPMLPTRKMKKTKTWVRCRRSPLARINGRISSMAAPVVPSRLAPQRTEAEQRQIGVRRPDEVAADADAARHDEQRQQQHDEGQVFVRQSGEQGRSGLVGPARRPRRAGRKAAPRPAVTLGKCRSHQCRRTSGIRAIDSRSPAKGRPQARPGASARCGVVIEELCEDRPNLSGIIRAGSMLLVECFGCTAEFSLIQRLTVRSYDGVKN